MKAFVLSYAHYRRLGFSEVESIDLALSRPRVTPITAAVARRDSKAQERRAQMRVVK